jgi:hypothetical protein
MNTNKQPVQVVNGTRAHGGQQQASAEFFSTEALALPIRPNRGLGSYLSGGADIGCSTTAARWWKQPATATVAVMTKQQIVRILIDRLLSFRAI